MKKQKDREWETEKHKKKTKLSTDKRAKKAKKKIGQNQVNLFLNFKLFSLSLSLFRSRYVPSRVVVVVGEFVKLCRRRRRRRCCCPKERGDERVRWNGWDLRGSSFKDTPACSGPGITILSERSGQGEGKKEGDRWGGASSVTNNKSPNVYKSCPKMFSQ